MEKLIKGYGERLRSVVLYIDDLEKIVDFFKEASDTVIIKTEEYKFDNVKEIKNIYEEKIHYLEIESKNPHISLTLTPNNTSLYTGEDTLISRGVFEKVKHILNQRRKKFSWLIQNDLLHLIICAVMGYLVAQPLSYGIHKRNIYFISLFFLLLSIIALYQAWWLRSSIRQYNIIYLKSKIERPSFWKRKRDDIILAFISASLGALITFIITKILK